MLDHNKIVVVLSGGLDSATLMFDARRGKMGVLAISFDYGQRHRRELEAAYNLCFCAGVPHKVIAIPGLAEVLGGSALTDLSMEVPEGHYEADSMKATVVPNRNMIFLSIAAGYAIAQGAGFVGFGAHAGDHAIYPDCRPEFATAMSEVLVLANSEVVSLASPFIHWTKAQIVHHGYDLGVPFGETYSCYKGGRIHCGKCGTCVERKEAFKLAGVPDPTIYKE